MCLSADWTASPVLLNSTGQPRLFYFGATAAAAAVWGFALSTMHHAVGVVHVPLAAALRYLPSGDPESPLNTAKAVRPYLGLCCLLLPASAAFPGVRSFLFAGLRLPASPRALAVFGLACLPRCPLSWLVFLAPSPLLFWFGWLAWLGFLLGWVGLASLCGGGFVLFFVCSCASRVLALPDVSLDWDIRIFCFHLHH